MAPNILLNCMRVKLNQVLDFLCKHFYLFVGTNIHIYATSLWD